MTGAVERFQPLSADRVTMYTCGPTVWDFAHVGNFRAFLFYDLLRRHLEFIGHRVVHVMNLTDIDDRILAGAARSGSTCSEFAAPFATAFFEDLEALRIRPADVYPRASEHIPEMVELITKLLEGGHAYAADGDVYFRIDSFGRYGRLAHLDRAGLRPGARVNQDDYDKESVSDFALWKGEQPGDALYGAVWKAPFGAGRPGWHIECSAMSMRYLGETLDIHCGGIDLVFPHHENEIAQSEAATGRKFAAYWLHSEHLFDLTGAKMSKRLGNIATIRELLAAGHDPLAIRFFLIANAHYRSRVRFDESGIHAASEQVRRLREFAGRLARLDPPSIPDDPLEERTRETRERYRAALDDDLNLPQAMGHVFDVIRDANAAVDRGEIGAGAVGELEALLLDADRHLDVLRTGTEGSLDSEVEDLIEKREAARRARDFARADAIRSDLRARGILLEDSREGVRWRRVRA
jgi:cysteinyl-tRNA synthetase